jgi:hypothetical protein
MVTKPHNSVTLFVTWHALVIKNDGIGYPVWLISVLIAIQFIALWDLGKLFLALLGKDEERVIWTGICWGLKFILEVGWSLLDGSTRLFFQFEWFRDEQLDVSTRLLFQFVWFRGEQIRDTPSSPMTEALRFAAKILEYAPFDPENLLVDMGDYYCW